MNKPSNYDNTSVMGDRDPIELGGHIVVIKQVEEIKSKTGKDMIKVSFDFAQGDVQEGYFEKIFRDDIRPDKRWPNAGCNYFLVEDQNGNCSKQFKSFVTSVEKSNPGFVVNWGDGFAQCFKNKIAGGVFGIVNDFYNGRPFKKRELRWFRSTESIKEANIPLETETKAYRENIGSSQNKDVNGFMNIPDGMDEELPFN